MMPAIENFVVLMWNIDLTHESAPHFVAGLTLRIGVYLSFCASFSIQKLCDLSEKRAPLMVITSTETDMKMYVLKCLRGQIHLISADILLCL